MPPHRLITFFYIMFIAAVFGNNTTETTKQIVQNFTKSREELNNTKLTMVSEGGLLGTNIVDLSLSKENFTSLLDLDEEIGKSKDKPVVPRKGVDNFLPKNNVQASSVEQNVTNTSTTKPVNAPVVPEHRNASTVPIISTTPKTVHKKPLILSYEALASAGLVTHPAPIPSSKTKESSQIPSPNEGSIIKKYATKVNSHPGMVMPIIITVLVVPMFAIVGYMAVKRGQEAWKNRHYKRMDFLLDGMYND